MPIIPEKLSSRQDVKSTIACQFWEQPSHSTHSIDGQVWSLPCEPPALNLTGSSGLSRTQQIIAAQALGVPAFPSYDASSEGLAQSLQDLENYGIAARGRFQLSRRITLNGVLESTSTTHLHRRAISAVHKLRQHLKNHANTQSAPASSVFAAEGAQGPSSDEAPSISRLQSRSEAILDSVEPSTASRGRGGRWAYETSPEEGKLVRGHGTLRYSLAGHDLTATVGYHQDYVDSNGDYAHVPLAASLDLASHYRPDGLQYRVGFHQATSCTASGAADAAARFNIAHSLLGYGPSGGGDRAASRRLRTTLHVQGAVAVEGEAHIWKPLLMSTAVSSQSPAAGVAGPSSAGTLGGIEGGKEGSGVPSSKASPGPVTSEMVSTSAASPTSPAPAVMPTTSSQGLAVSPFLGSVEHSTSTSGHHKSPIEAAQATVSDSGAAVAGPASKPSRDAMARLRLAVQQGNQMAPQGQTPGQVLENDGNKGSKVATALASAAQADAGPDPASLPPSRLRFRRQKKAGSSSVHEGEAVDGTSTPQHHHRHSRHKHKHRRSSIDDDDRAAAKGVSPASIDPEGNSEQTAASNLEAATRINQKEGSSGISSKAQQQQPESPQNAGSLDSFIKPLEDFLHTVTHANEAGASQDQQREDAQQQHQEGSPASLPARAEQLLSVSAHTIQSGIQESLALLEQVKQSVARLTAEVQEGSLQRISQQLATDTRKEAPRRRPYSVFLSQPHLKINGSMGCLARMPLPPLRGSASLEPFVGGSRNEGSRMPATGSSASLSSLGANMAQAWEPYLKGTSLRLFASGGISGQLGRFTRPFLDFTALALRADVGLTSPHVVGLLPDPAQLGASDTHRPDKHRAFALEGRGIWHSLSASLAQQVYGPVRARADFRFALDPTNMPQTAGERSTIKGLAQTALSMRPSLLEAVLGFDVVLPGTEGAARLACWWSPHRKEAMAELRLF